MKWRNIYVALFIPTSRNPKDFRWFYLRRSAFICVQKSFNYARRNFPLAFQRRASYIPV